MLAIIIFICMVSMAHATVLPTAKTLADLPGDSGQVGRYIFTGTNKLFVYDHSRINGTSIKTGQVSIYTDNAGTWEHEEDVDTLNDNNNLDCYGFTVLSDTEFAIACGETNVAYAEDNNVKFFKDDGGWSMIKKFSNFSNYASDYEHLELELNNHNGNLVSHNGDKVVVHYDSNVDNYGMIMFKNNGGTWEVHQVLEALDGRSSEAMEFMGDHLVSLEAVFSSKNIRVFTINATGYLEFNNLYTESEYVYELGRLGKYDFGDGNRFIFSSDFKDETINPDYYPKVIIYEIDLDTGIITKNATLSEAFPTNSIYYKHSQQFGEKVALISDTTILIKQVTEYYIMEYFDGQWTATSRMRNTFDDIDFFLTQGNTLFVSNLGSSVDYYNTFQFGSTTDITDYSNVINVYEIQYTIDNENTLLANDGLGRNIDVNSTGYVTASVYKQGAGITRVIDPDGNVVISFDGDNGARDDCGKGLAVMKDNVLLFDCENTTDSNNHYVYSKNFDTGEDIIVHNPGCDNSDTSSKRDGNFAIYNCDHPSNNGDNFHIYELSNGQWGHRTGFFAPYSGNFIETDLAISNDGEYIVISDESSGGATADYYLFKWNGTDYDPYTNNPITNPHDPTATINGEGYHVDISENLLIMGGTDDTEGGYVITARLEDYFSESLPPRYYIARSLQAGFGKVFAYDNYHLAVTADDFISTWEFNGSDWNHINTYPLPTNTLYGEIEIEGNYFAVGDETVFTNTGAIGGAIMFYEEVGFTNPFSGFIEPTSEPTTSPTWSPTTSPTESPTVPGATPAPSTSPTTSPTNSPSTSPTNAPTSSPVTPSPTPPTNQPTLAPTTSPTEDVGTVIHKSTVKYFVRNDTARFEVTQDIIDQFNTNYPDTVDYYIKETITSEEEGTVNSLLVTTVGNDTLLEEKLAQVRCGSAAPNCQVTVNGGRRMLMSEHGRKLDSQLLLEITFDLDSSLLSTVNGFDLNDPEFEAELLDALGLDNTTEITVTSNAGDITIVATLEANPSTDPLGEELAATGQEAGENLEAITESLLLALGVGPDNALVLSTTLEYCPVERDCNGRGVCDPETGICACVGNWWGIECETPCECVNGGECKNALCHCDYPFYGLRCNSTSTECQVCEAT